MNIIKIFLNFRPTDRLLTILRAFSVTVETVFHGTHTSPKNSYLVLGLMLNTKKFASACQITRDLGIRRATVWNMMHRIRTEKPNDIAQSKRLCSLMEGCVKYMNCYNAETFYRFNTRKDTDSLNSALGLMVA